MANAPTQPNGKAGAKKSGGVIVDSLNVGDLSDDFGSTYGVGLILAHPELLVLAYKSQGWVNARIDPKNPNKIIKGENDGSSWDASTTGAALQESKWYQSRDGNKRLSEAARLSDPSSWNTRVDNLTANVKLAATKSGADLSTLTPEQLRSFSEQILSDNWGSLSSSVDEGVPDRLLNAYLAPLIRKSPTTGAFTGGAGANAEALRQKAESYGLNLSDQWYLNAVQGLQSGKTTQADLDTQIIEQSRSRYVGLAGMISGSRSLQDIADPYIQMLAQTLDRSSADIQINDPDIQGALQVVDSETGKVRSKSLFEFQQDLRKKPEWINTRQGRAEMNQASMQMLKDFGFVK